MMFDNEQLLYHQIFHGLRFFLFGFEPIFKNQVRLKLLEGGGVEVSRCGLDCTHVIVDKDNVVYDDPVCAVARRDGKVVVTSLWVDHSCDLGMLVAETPIIYRPVRDLNGIPGAKSFVICLTGFQRQDREDIMTMVGLMGATFSKALVASKITHLVCFKFEGDKYELAKKIVKIKLVNHCWLDDCLKAWEILPEINYNKSSYELEMMEAEAKDSEEEREHLPAEPHSGRKVQSPQNLHIEGSPHQPSLVDSEILINNKLSNASMVLAGPNYCNHMPSVTKNNTTTSCSTSGTEGIWNKNPDLPTALDTHTISKGSPHKPSLVDSEILINNKCSNASIVLAGPDNCNDMPSVTKNNTTTSCSTSGTEGIWNKNPDLPTALDTHTIGEGSPHQPSLVDSEILIDNKRSNASMVLAGPNNCNDMPSVTKNNTTTSCSTSGMEGIWNKNPDLPTTLDTHTISEESPHQLSLVENKRSNASMVLAGPDNCNDMPSVTKNNTIASCSTSGMEGIWTKNPDLPTELDTHNIGEASGVPLNHYATAITPEMDGNNLASTYRTAEKSPSTPITRSSSRRSLPKVGFPVCSAQRKSNLVSTLTEDKSTFNVSDMFDLSLSIEGPSETSSGGVETPVRQHLSHLEQSTTDDLPDKRKVVVSGLSGKSQKLSDDLAALAPPLHSGGPSDALSCFSVSKAMSCTEYQHGLDDPSRGDLIKDISNSSGLINTNLFDEVGPNSNLKQGRKKMLARKVLGSSSRFGKWSTMNKKGSIRSSTSSGGKQVEDYDPERVKLLNVSADKNINAIIEGINIQESRSETTIKARPQDDETETPENEADVFYVASHKDDLDPMTSEIEISFSGGANNNDDIMGANQLMTTDQENSKCASGCSATVEVNGVDHATTERLNKGRKRPFLKTKEHAKGKNEAINGDTQEKVPKKVNDGKAKKTGKNPLTTSDRAKGGGQVVGMNEAVTRDKENNPTTVCTVRDVPKKTYMENTTAETIGKPRKCPLTKTKSHHNMKKAANNWEMQENVSKVVVNNEQTENGEKISSVTSGQSTISAQENSLSSLQMERENIPISFPEKGDKRHSGKVSSKSKENPVLTEMKGVPSNYAPGLAEHAMKVKEPVFFLLSGHKIQRKEFQQVVRRLGGKVCRDSHCWSYQATHLILPEPVRRTEKFFAAAASGRWILKTDYLTASNGAGKLLDEHPYEWHENSLTADGSINLIAPQKWRQLRERTGHGAFCGLRMIVYGECIAPPLDTLKRTVRAGDGTILATSPPYNRFLESGIDFAIVSPGMPHVDVWIQEFLRHEIPCVLADYLVDYVCKPGYSLDKYVQYGTHSWAEKSHQNLVSRMEDIVEDQAFRVDQSSERDEACEICGSRDRGEVMLICGDESGLSGCGTGIHIDCCDPPLSEVPLEDWFCPKCRTTEKVPTKKPRGKKA